MNFYNEIAHSYNDWIENDSQANDLTKFYRAYLENIDVKNIVYLGIATGRIALELTKNSPFHIIGVDSSSVMLEVCQKYFKDNDAQNRLTLLSQDILSLNIQEKNNIYLLPFRTIMHFLTKEDKKNCLKSVYTSMDKGEIFIFDMDIFNEELAKKNDGETFLSYHDERTGKVIYNEYSYDLSKQLANIKLYTAIKDGEKLKNISKHDYTISWIDTKEIKKIILELGFIIKDFRFKNEHQIWILEK